MKFQVTDRVAIFQTDAILGMTDDQAGHRSHQLEALGKGRYRVIGPNVKFQRGETIEWFDNGDIWPAAKVEAEIFGVKFGDGIGPKALDARIEEAKAANTKLVKAMEDALKAQATARRADRAKAAKHRASLKAVSWDGR